MKTFDVLVTETVRSKYTVQARTGPDAVMQVATLRATGVEPVEKAVVDTRVSKPSQVSDAAPTLDLEDTAPAATS